jgi:ribosomal protein S3
LLYTSKPGIVIGRKGATVATEQTDLAQQSHEARGPTGDAPRRAGHTY